MQTKYCQKLSRLNNITYASRNLFTVRIIQWRTVMWCIPHLSKCPPFSGTVILMTFACALKTATLLSRNFISISMVTNMFSKVLGKLERFGYSMLKKLWWYVKPFWFNTRMWQTDGRTELLYQYHRSALLCWWAIKNMKYMETCSALLI